jgi:8-hydroxy-5-deazaflavin:NADPH oxidoreductase
MAERILMIGAGNVGGALGRAWLKHGHDVRFGVPDPTNSKYADLPKQRLQPPDQRRGAGIVVLATPFGAVRSAIAMLGDLSGAVVIDCTNPLAMGSQGLHLTVGHDTSGAEQIATWAAGAAVFKTLNQTGAENLADAGAYHSRPVMFVAGDDADKKPIVMSLVADLGFQAVDAGPLIAARLLEPLGMLWIELAMQRGQGRDFAFAMVRHPRTETT